jgi:hypothetical protein
MQSSAPTPTSAPTTAPKATSASETSAPSAAGTGVEAAPATGIATGTSAEGSVALQRQQRRLQNDRSINRKDIMRVNQNMKIKAEVTTPLAVIPIIEIAIIKTIISNSMTIEITTIAIEMIDLIETIALTVGIEMTVAKEAS